MPSKSDNFKGSAYLAGKKDMEAKLARPGFPDSVKVLVSKVSRLMQEGATTGEMLSAKAALERIAHRHGTTLEALGVLDTRTARPIPLPKSDNALRTIMLLVIKLHAPECELRPTGDEYQDKPTQIAYLVHEGKFSDYEYAVLYNLLNDYCSSWMNYQNDALVAWINSQGILPKNAPTKDQGEMSPEDVDRINRIRAMAKVAKKVDTKKKLIK